MLAIETAEIGGTMVALSAPALKVFFGRIYQSSSFHSSNKVRSTGRRTKHGTREQDRGTELEGWTGGVVGNGAGMRGEEGSAEEVGVEDGRGSEEDLLVVGPGVGRKGSRRKDGGVKVTTMVEMRTEAME